MTIRNNLFILLAAFLLTGFYSCKKMLNALPAQSVADGNLIVDQNSAEYALNGAYYRFAAVTTTTTGQVTRWTAAHETTPAMLSGWMLLGSGTLVFQNHSYLPSSTGDWQLPYGILNAANGTIDGVEKLADDHFSGNRKKEILAEARFLRAYAHFFLLSYFGEWYSLNSKYGVMLRKLPLTLNTASNVPRSSVKESYDYILQDLDYAIDNAPENRPIYYANKAAAQALKIRVLMSRGQATDYTDLITIANAVIANPNYALEANLKDIFQTKGLTSKEVILGITPFASQLVKKPTYEYTTNAGIYYVTKAFRNLLQNDPRATWMLRAIPSTAPVAIKDSTSLSKFSGPKVEESYTFRLTEVYLMKAEAIVRSGGSLTDAKNILKDIMGHAGVTNFTAVDNATTRDEILYQLYLEYSRNMIAEDGIEWFALLRLPFEKVQEIRPTITSKEKYIMPIPATEFQLNPSIGDQNPGYPKF